MLAPHGHDIGTLCTMMGNDTRFYLKQCFSVVQNYFIASNVDF